MHWVLQTNLFNEREWGTLVSTLERFHIPYSVHKVVPFVGELIPPAEPKSDKVICFGSYSMRHAAKTNGWTPGVYDLEVYSFSLQLKHWGDNMLNADSKVVAFKDVKITEPMFIRPVDDGKVFAGKVFDPVDFHEWQFGVCTMEHDYGSTLTGDTLVQVCKPKTIYAEYRYWIIDGRIVTRSVYKRGTRVGYSADVDIHIDRYAQSVGCANTLAARNPLPWLPKAFVLDVCETPDGMKIVEINTINSAGFYAGDVMKIIMALEDLEA